jgi:DNA polymerase-3 subunit alpha
MSKFTHLHVHSHYSLLDGLPQIDSLISNAKKKGFTALALTDHGTMFGAVEFYKKAKAADIKPIVGIEVYLALEHLADKRPKIDSDYYHLILLAKNFEGYKNLMQLTTIAHIEGFYYKPRIDKDVLRKFSRGLVCLSGCMRGDIPRALLNNDFKRAKDLAADYQSMFGDDFYLEIQRHQSTDPEYSQKEKLLNERLIQLSQETGIPLVATADSHYLERDDAEAQDLLLCVGLGRTVQDSNRLDMRHADLSLKSGKDMEKLFADLPEAVANTGIVADKIDLTIPLNTLFFPTFPVPEGYDVNTYLAKCAHEGIAQKDAYKGAPVPQHVLDRINYELDVIIKKNYSGYFLVVADFVNWARNNGIIATTRGSAAGSLVSYAIGITTVNPLDYQLPFERFLNPMRPSAPDIDMDFADNRRDDVIAYVTQKYGADKVAQIVTFGTMMARAAIRDMGRALGIAYAKCDKIAKMIPLGKQGFHMTINKALDLSPELKEVYDKDPETKRLIDLSLKVEGAARHASVHAAGIVIAPTPLTDYTPLQTDEDGRIITQYEMHSCEDAGLVKMDFLGIRNLSILGNAVEIVRHTKGVDIDLVKIPLDDKKTFRLLAAGKTMGLFQLGGSGMTRYLKELAPTKINDIMAMISLYRPGPMESIPEYIRRKNNPQLVHYLDPKMKNFLSMSYGIMTYQDDVLTTSIEIAGYTWEEADKFRKAMGKKIPKEMAAQKEKFLNGCISHSGYTREKALALWALIEPFAAYGFNKAHAASYGIVSYQTAYMKANYPVEFMAAVMTAEAGDPQTVSDAVEECKSMGIEVMPPDINESLSNFTVVDDKHIRFGLNAIKNLGSDVITEIIKQRKAGGPFKDLEDLATRLQTRGFNKKSWEALVKSGAMDAFGERGTLLASSDLILDYAREHMKSLNSAQSSLFGAEHLAKAKLKLREVEPVPKRDRLSWEKELLGLYVSAHPLDDFGPLLEKLGKPIRNIATYKGSVNIAGIITKVQKIITKKGDQMAFVDVEDLTGVVEILVFPTLFQKFRDIIEVEKIVIVTGKVSDKDGVPKLLVDEIKDIAAIQAQAAQAREQQRTQAQANNPPPANPIPKLESVTINIPVNATDAIFVELKKLFEAHPGEQPVNLMINQQQVKTPFRVAMNPQLEQKISQILS